MGVEAGLREAPPFRLSSLFPWANYFEGQQVFNLGAEEDMPVYNAAEGWEQARAERQQPGHDVIDMSHTLGIAGMLHIVHKATERLKSVMSEMATFLKDLEHICRIFRLPYLRHRFKQTCCLDPNAFVTFGLLFSGFDAHVLPGRWGTISHVATLLADAQRRTFIRTHWSFQRITFGQRQQQGPRGPEQEGETNFEDVDKAIQSEWFWSYVRMVSTLGSVINQLFYWIESCPCHFLWSHYVGTRRVPEHWPSRPGAVAEAHVQQDHCERPR